MLPKGTLSQKKKRRRNKRSQRKEERNSKIEGKERNKEKEKETIYKANCYNNSLYYWNNVRIYECQNVKIIGMELVVICLLKVTLMWEF